MSDQISEKMARKIYDAQKNYDAPGLCSGWERFFGACKSAGLIKPSKLDEAREFVRKVRADVTLHTAYREAVEDAEGFFEAAITEILEDRK